MGTFEGMARGRPPDPKESGGDDNLAKKATPPSKNLLISGETSLVGDVEYRIASLQNRVEYLTCLGFEASENQRSLTSEEQKQSWRHLELRVEEELSRANEELARLLAGEGEEHRAEKETGPSRELESEELKGPEAVLLALPPAPKQAQSTPKKGPLSFYEVQPIKSEKAPKVLLAPPPQTAKTSSEEPRRVDRRWHEPKVDAALDWTGIRRSETFQVTHSELVRRQGESIAKGLEQARVAEEPNQLDDETLAELTRDEVPSVKEIEVTHQAEGFPRGHGSERDDSDQRQRSRGHYFRWDEKDD